MKKTLVTGLGGLLAAAVFAAFAGSSAMAGTLDGLTNNASTPAVQVAEAKKEKLYRRLIKVDGGTITFKGPNQENVMAKVSEKRTKIYFSSRAKGLKKAMKEGKMAKVSKLKAGHICTITYVAGGDNEPSELACHVR